MTLQSAPYFWLTCDGLREDGERCDAKSTEGGEYGAWSDAGHAVDDATNSDWVEHEGNDYCEEHSLQFKCDDCGEIKDECVCEADRADVAEATK